MARTPASASPGRNKQPPSGEFTRELPGLFCYDPTVLSVTSIIVQTEPAPSPDLLQRAQSGDADAFCQFCRPHEARLFRQALSLCGESALAEDLAQDTMVEAWRCLPRYHGRCRFFTWLCAILLNRYRNVLREKRPVPFSALNPGEHESARHRNENLIDSTFQPDEAAERRERDLRLGRNLQRLSHKHRQVIHLRFFVDDSLEGIAAALNCSVGTVKSRLFHALENLRALHAEQNETEETL
jgi:RNA polymerase sigma-70 factor, ECF subfamily